tara:strand:- start:552 stop:731 length:180 start_codon:yes stop_codon:yes gene_type:complete
MLNKNQIQRLLAHCEKINDENKNKEMCGEAMRNLGWVQALRLVLSDDNLISSKPLNEEK